MSLRRMGGGGAILLAVVIALPAWADGVSGSPRHAEPARLAVGSLLLAGAMAGERLVVVGERGHILISADGGATWQQAAVPVRTMLTAVDFANESLGCAVGHDEAIVCTRDGGSTWELTHYSPEEMRPLLAVLFLDERRVLATGAYGCFLESSDGGESWSERRINEEDMHFNHLARTASGRLYIAAESGTLLRSDDDGVTWKELPSPYSGSFFGTLSLGGEVVLAFGLRGNLFRSENGGESWFEIDTGTEALLGHGVVLADGSVVVSGLGGAVLESRDGGKSFVLHQQQDRKGVTAVLQARNGSLIRVGEGGVRGLLLDTPKTDSGAREGGRS